MYNVMPILIQSQTTNCVYLKRLILFSLVKNFMYIKPIAETELFGDRYFQKCARATLPVLIYLAENKEIKTFSELKSFIGNSRRWYCDILNSINSEFCRISRSTEWKYAEIPTISALVVSKNTNLSKRNPSKIKASKWMQEQMVKQLKLDYTIENYHKYCVEPVFDYDYWQEAMARIVKLPQW